ncbi:sigma-70 family RNA polymerase sigma factor [Paenarthrobacter aurescens]|uniref:RNA polymerase sigma24 factor n=1 Tax=Paenarthrobacter aurescens TaxID=43663 RepID=A0A4Y3N6Z0_PAEAU|nr:sigma-70 family RNA polymerase sigma factor [Paenarthrobacter aurescens]MDO6145033.1 sigma-70 family RNA polymerase sigma factor [Paenarthrobacter aurescens]MDO6148878.1 sigma-70 family RNA polymerase sigma factor [Paenarthrobacter aurescens]MDO6160124.1 sigma-70 family RNA polymerase sigma factor [Paenarthrobacter aurescens]MDO6163983.1 sigma-70 family RNA polymerase sigma factor [Paenarthrobacter aurescens]GEB17302.1 RNA polymerase sigma24 factor [Paenarthrobacter aurescens]
MSLAVSATSAWLSERNRLLGIAYRMLGDFGHAEDVVSEVAIDAVQRERNADPVDSWPAWLTTVCVRRSVDRVRQLAAVREDYTGPWLPEPVDTSKLPDEAVANRELLSLTLLHLAEQLAPEARAALVLHRAFGMSAPEIGDILEKTPAAVRQMISRAGRRLDIDPEAPAPRARDRVALEKLVRAIEQGDIDTVVAMLDGDAVLWADGGGKVKSAMNPLFGAARIARFFAGILGKAVVFDPVQPVSVGIMGVNGEAAMVLRHHGRSDILVINTGPDGSIRELRQVSNPDKLTRVSLEG